MIAISIQCGKFVIYSGRKHNKSLLKDAIVGVFMNVEWLWMRGSKENEPVKWKCFLLKQNSEIEDCVEKKTNQLLTSNAMHLHP